MLTRVGYYTGEIKIRIAIVKDAINIKISLLKSKLNIELRRNLVRYYVGNITLHGLETWTLRIKEQKYLESFEMSC